uniref:Uncharacterized protein n=1 Tax=Arundo donax TaxID=35708 RepID=A0A0A8YG89_ARUDO
MVCSSEQPETASNLSCCSSSKSGRRSQELQSAIMSCLRFRRYRIQMGNDRPWYPTIFRYSRHCGG